MQVITSFFFTPIYVFLSFFLLYSSPSGMVDLAPTLPMPCTEQGQVPALLAWTPTDEWGVWVREGRKIGGAEQFP